jgi:hypothetical protein
MLTGSMFNIKACTTLPISSLLNFKILTLQIELISNLTIIFRSTLKYRQKNNFSFEGLILF